MHTNVIHNEHTLQSDLTPNTDAVVASGLHVLTLFRWLRGSKESLRTSAPHATTRLVAVLHVRRDVSCADVSFWSAGACEGKLLGGNIRTKPTSIEITKERTRDLNINLLE